MAAVIFIWRGSLCVPLHSLWFVAMMILCRSTQIQQSTFGVAGLHVQSGSLVWLAATGTGALILVQEAVCGLLSPVPSVGASRTDSQQFRCWMGRPAIKNDILFSHIVTGILIMNKVM